MSAVQAIGGITHVQTEPATVWAVQHNLHTRTPVLDVLIAVGGELIKVMPKQVRMVDENTVEITWSYPTAGRVRVV